MKISIVIVTYNSINLIKDCLYSIFKYNDIGNDLEVIIADNASDDQTNMFNLIKREFGNQQIKLYNTGENGGYGKGNNFGIDHAKAEIVVIMNPDVRFVAPIFKRIIDEFKDPELGMAGLEFIDGSSPYYFKPEYNTLLRSLFMHFYIKRRKYDSKRMYMSGSLMIFKRRTFIAAGKYDENIFMYYEEPDITNRILKVGKKVKWLKGVMVLHLAHGRKFNEKLTNINNNSFEYYCNKYGIDSFKHYRIDIRILQLKIVVSKLLRDNNKTELFSKTIASLNRRLKLLNTYSK